MRFETVFEVPGTPDNVIEKFANVPLMASLLPGAHVGEARADGSYPGALQVSFGPKRLAFKGTVTNKVDRESRSGVVKGQGNADVRGAKIAVTMKYSLAAAAGSMQPATQVKLVSEAQLSGLLAEFARTGGVALTDAILAEFCRNFSDQFGPTSKTALATEKPPEALSALSLASGVIRSKFRLCWRALVSPRSKY